MDRELPRAVRRAGRARATVRILAPVLLLGTVIALLPGWMRPSVARVRLRVATVQQGPLDAVLTASGTLVPEIERVISSPVDARLLRVLERAGSAVRTGDPIAELDLSESALALDRLVMNGRITDNQQAQVQVTLDQSLADLDGRIERAAMDLQLLLEKADGNDRLFKAGLVSQQATREARLAAQQAEISLRQLQRTREHTAASAALQGEGLALQRAVADREAAQARRVLELGTARAEGDGVVTWVLSQEGALVRRGEMIARTADLRSFRVDATASDVHAGRIRLGAPVVVPIGEARLEGTIAEVQPSVEGGVVRFKATLAQADYPSLRPNLRVDVLVVTDRRAATLKVRDGSFPDLQGEPQAFVIRGGRAVRTPVRFGIRGFEEVEVLSGLHAGDEVVISDMRDYAHLEELEVR